LNWSFSWCVYAADIDISSKRRDVFSSSIISNNLGNPPVTDNVAVQNGLGCSVSGAPSRSWAAVATVPCLPQVPLTCGVWGPGTILGTDGVNISSSHAVELATSVEEPLCTIPRNTRADTGDLLLDTRVMLNTPGDICPGPIILT